jgi:DDE superfamily endonuclease
LGEKANYYSAVCLQTGDFDHMPVEGNTTAETSVVFLEQLHERHAEPLIVIWDNGPAHHGPEVRAYLATPNLRLRLVPLPGYSPPLMSGGQTLPSELLSSAVAHAMVEREPVLRKIEFSGHTWNLKPSETRAGPGPNYFSDSQTDVWVDESGQLHLRIVYRNNRWYCTEVFTSEPLGYGGYTFTLASRVDQLDKNVVLGLFTWDDTAPEYNYREIDIEFSRWGEEGGDNSQFVVQPWDHAGNRHRFNMVLEGSHSLHRFNWTSGSVQFSSYQGRPPDLGGAIETWAYTGPDIPPAGTGNARINLWLLNGDPPSDGQGVEVIVEAFEFAPQTQVRQTSCENRRVKWHSSGGVGGQAPAVLQ